MQLNRVVSRVGIGVRAHVIRERVDIRWRHFDNAVGGARLAHTVTVGRNALASTVPLDRMEGEVD